MPKKIANEFLLIAKALGKTIVFIIQSTSMGIFLVLAFFWIGAAHGWSLYFFSEYQIDSILPSLFDVVLFFAQIPVAIFFLTALSTLFSPLVLLSLIVTPKTTIPVISILLFMSGVGMVADPTNKERFSSLREQTMMCLTLGISAIFITWVLLEPFLKYVLIWWGLLGGD